MCLPRGGHTPRSPAGKNQAEDQALLEAMKSHYDQLKLDPEAWEHYRAEVTAWDTTAGDGPSVSG